jgi:hypothetical protein
LNFGRSAKNWRENLFCTGFQNLPAGTWAPMALAGVSLEEEYWNLVLIKDKFKHLDV